MLRLGTRLVVLMLAGSVLACQSINPQAGAPLEKPKFTKDTKLQDAYNQSISYGAESLQELRDMARERQQLMELHKLAESDLVQKHDTLPTTVLFNVAHVYRVSANSMNPSVLLAMARSKQESVRRIGWRLAATRPSSDIAKAIETLLSESLAKGREEEVLVPEMASAVQENGIKSAFSFLVLGLMREGQPEYANAMLALDPGKAANPFIDYLNKADLDDLRQLSQKSINLLTCTVIFRFFIENPLPMSHPNIAQIFQYAVSRNRALSEMAYAVLEKHIPENRSALAVLLARQPVPVQVAFIESSQRESTSNLRLFLDDMKDVVQQKEVIEELNSQQGATDQ